MRAQAEAELYLDRGGKINAGTNTNGESVGQKIVQLAGIDLLCDQRDVDEISSTKRNVDASGQVDSGTNADDKVEGESGSESQLKKTGIDLEVGRGNELNGLVNSGVGGDVDGDVGLEALQVEADNLLGGEVIESLEVDETLNLGLADVQAKVNGGIGGGVDSGNTVLCQLTLLSLDTCSTHPLKRTSLSQLAAQSKTAGERSRPPVRPGRSA